VAAGSDGQPCKNYIVCHFLTVSDKRISLLVSYYYKGPHSRDVRFLQSFLDRASGVLSARYVCGLRPGSMLFRKIRCRVEVPPRRPRWRRAMARKFGFDEVSLLSPDSGMFTYRERGRILNTPLIARPAIKGEGTGRIPSGGGWGGVARGTRGRFAHRAHRWGWLLVTS
jgi:hypothetical protein